MTYFDQENSHKSFALPGSRPHYNPDRPGQVEHIALDLKLDIPYQRCQGACAIYLKPVQDGLTTLTLDAVNMQIDWVHANGQTCTFDYDGEQLQVQLLQPTAVGQRIELAIAYQLDQPQRGLYFIAPDEDYPNKPVQVWTQGEDEDSRFWFPCFDYPGQLATSEIRVRVPSAFVAISNGELRSVITDEDTKIYHWFQPQVHPTYLMTLAVGEFTEFQDEWNGKPVTYYVEKNRTDDALRSMGKTPRMIEFFSQAYGYPYPYPKYAQVCVDDFIFGGMENTSTTLLTDRCLLDERASLDNRQTESLVAHELAHQWFGDLVVIRHWSHAWLKEGMASYAEVLWVDHEYGADDAAYYRLGQARQYLAEDAERYRRPIVTHVYREAIELYDRHLYEKGSCVYHMIRATLGENAFWQAISHFVQENAHKTVETIDLLRAIDQATGKNLMPLFDQYVFRGGHPDYKVNYRWDGESNLAQLTVTQTQVEKGKEADTLFDLNVAIAFHFEAPDQAPQTVKIRIHEAEQSFYFPLLQKPSFVSFDVGNPLLKTLTLDYPVPELKAQLHHDPDPVSRIYAAQALAKKGGLEGVKALSDALVQDRFWGVRAEVAKELATVQLNQAFSALSQGLQDDDARVRRAVVNALANIKTDASYIALQALSGGDPSYYVEAAVVQALGAIASSNLCKSSREPETLDFLKKVLETRSGWNEVVRSGAIAGLSQFKTSEVALDLILDYTQMGVPQSLRLSAVRSLGAISKGQSPAAIDRIIQRLSELSRESFFLTQVSVVAALRQVESPKALGILSGLGDQTPDGRVRRIAEEAAQQVQKSLSGQRGLQQLQDTVSQLKQENQDLKSRLAALEARIETS
jgi:aminopeptidase N